MRGDVIRAARNASPGRLRLMHRQLHRGIVNRSDIVLVAVLRANSRSDGRGENNRRGNRYESTYVHVSSVYEIAGGAMVERGAKPSSALRRHNSRSGLFVGRLSADSKNLDRPATIPVRVVYSLLQYFRAAN